MTTGNFAKSFTICKKHTIDIALLQETHLPINSPLLRSRVLRNNVHASGFNTHARGVITWVNPKSPYTLTPLETDNDGRYTISKCQGRGMELIIVNIY